jgi:Zn-dependent protease with chaperone function
LVLMQSASIWVSIASLLLVFAISLAGRFSAKSRPVLLAVFSPGLYITMGTTCAIVVVDAALLFGAIWFGESALIGRVHVGIMLSLGIGAAFGVFAMVKATFRALGKATSYAIGRKLTDEQAPELWAYVRDLSKSLSAHPPANIVVGLEANFYVTEANVVCLDGTLTGRTLFISLPLSRILNRGELTAVIGHELGHFIGADTKFSLRFYPIYRGASEALVALQPGNSEQGAGVTLATMPALLILGHFLEAFSVAENGIGRQRELEADKVGARLGGEKNLATALVKIHAFSPFWDGMDPLIRKTLSDGKALINTSSIFADVVAENSKREVLNDLSEARMTHPTDSHPTLSDRLTNLAASVEGCAPEALITKPVDPAISLIRDFETIEKELSDVKQSLMLRNNAAVEPGAGNAGDQQPGTTPRYAELCVGCKAPIDTSAVIRCLKCNTPVAE